MQVPVKQRINRATAAVWRFTNGAVGSLMHSAVLQNTKFTLGGQHCRITATRTPLHVTMFACMRLRSGDLLCVILLGCRVFTAKLTIKVVVADVACILQHIMACCMPSNLEPALHAV